MATALFTFYDETMEQTMNKTSDTAKRLTTFELGLRPGALYTAKNPRNATKPWHIFAYDNPSCMVKMTQGSGLDDLWMDLSTSEFYDHFHRQPGERAQWVLTQTGNRCTLDWVAPNGCFMMKPEDGGPTVMCAPTDFTECCSGPIGESPRLPTEDDLPQPPCFADRLAYDKHVQAHGVPTARFVVIADDMHTVQPDGSLKMWKLASESKGGMRTYNKAEFYLGGVRLKQAQAPKSADVDIEQLYKDFAGVTSAPLKEITASSKVTWVTIPAVGSKWLTDDSILTVKSLDRDAAVCGMTTDRGNYEFTYDRRRFGKEFKPLPKRDDWYRHNKTSRRIHICSVDEAQHSVDAADGATGVGVFISLAALMQDYSPCYAPAASAPAKRPADHPPHKAFNPPPVPAQGRNAVCVGKSGQEAKVTLVDADGPVMTIHQDGIAIHKALPKVDTTADLRRAITIQSTIAPPGITTAAFFAALSSFLEDPKSPHRPKTEADVEALAEVLRYGYPMMRGSK